ncbi:MAG: septal ring lytic transglycosylase RlpA family protein [Candidatus Binatia bacterium]
MNSFPTYSGLWSRNPRRHVEWLIIFILSSIAQSCAIVPGTSNDMIKTVSIRPDPTEKRKAGITPHTPKPSLVKVHTGEASWYGPGFHGKKTASGEIFDQGKLTAAHRTFPLGSRARVTHLGNGKSVEVEINDRGPYVDGRIIDLSQAAARALGIIEDGIAPVRVELIGGPGGETEARRPR